MTCQELMSPISMIVAIHVVSLFVSLAMIGVTVLACWLLTRRTNSDG